MHILTKKRRLKGVKSISHYCQSWWDTSALCIFRNFSFKQNEAATPTVSFLLCTLLHEALPQFLHINVQTCPSVSPLPEQEPSYLPLLLSLMGFLSSAFLSDQSSKEHKEV